MKSLYNFLLSNGFDVMECTERLIIAHDCKYGSVRIEKNRNDFYLLDIDSYLNDRKYFGKSNKFTDIRKLIINKCLN